MFANSPLPPPNPGAIPYVFIVAMVTTHYYIRKIMRK